MLSFDTVTQKALAEPFDPKFIDFRPDFNQKWTADDGLLYTQILPYIDARAVMERLDAVVTPAYWRDVYEAAPQGGVLCRAGICINGDWVEKCDGAENTKIEEVKGGLSDAFKRAWVKWGVARYLYFLPRYAIPYREVRKRFQFMYYPKFPASALPSGYEYPEMAEDKTPYGEYSYPYVGNKTNGAGNSVSAAVVRTVESIAIPSATVQAPTAEVSVVDVIRRAMSYTVPEGCARAGETLGVAMRDPRFGKQIVTFLAGETPNPAGVMYTPKGDDGEKLQKAAGFLAKNFSTAIGISIAA